MLLDGGVTGVALAVAPESRIAGAEHEVVGAGAAEERLMEVVAQGEAVGQRLQDRRLLLLGVVEAHLVAFADVALRRIGASRWPSRRGTDR